MDSTTYDIKYLLFLAFVSAMGGLLFGYDWVVIGGAKPFYELFFNITEAPTLQGWAMSSALIGCVVGAIVSGVVADKIGRKKPLILAAILFTLSALGTGFADAYTPFIIYRLIGGLGIGLASTLSPMYIAEIAPAKYRGRFVAINQLTIVVGILAAQIVNLWIAEPISDTVTSEQILSSWNGRTGWRIMFWAELVPAGLFFIFMFFIPESPRFLVKVENETRASTILRKIGGTDYAISELLSIKNSFQETVKETIYKSKSEILSPKVLPIMIIGVVLAVFQQ